MPQIVTNPLNRPRFLGVAACCAALLATLPAWRAAAGDTVPNEQPAARSNVDIADEWVTISVPEGRSLRTFIARPAAPATIPAVVIVHEGRGLSAWERGFAVELAAAGNVTIVPDFFSGAAPDGGGTAGFESSGAAHDAVLNLPPAQVLSDLDVAVELARAQYGATKVAVIGFGWGGTQAFRYAVGAPPADVVMVFCGAAPNDEQLQQLGVPVHVFYAENDVTITGNLSRLKSRLKELDKPFTTFTAHGAGHGFMRTGEAADAKPADRKARTQAMTRVQELLSAL